VRAARRALPLAIGAEPGAGELPLASKPLREAHPVFLVRAHHGQARPVDAVRYAAAVRLSRREDLVAQLPADASVGQDGESPGSLSLRSTSASASRNARYSALVTSVRAMRNAPTSTSCLGWCVRKPRVASSSPLP